MKLARRPAEGSQGRREQGFSLAELMITVAILAIIVAVALPSYRSYVLRGNRTDAVRSLAFYQQALERCYTQAFTYVGCAQIPGAPVASGNGYYTISFNVPAASQYTILATAAGSQVADTQCTTMQVTQSGTQSAADNGGVNTTQACWAGN